MPGSCGSIDDSAGMQCPLTSTMRVPAFGDPVRVVRAERHGGARGRRERARFEPAQVRVLPVFLSLRRESGCDEALQRGAPQLDESIVRHRRGQRASNAAR